MRKLLKRVLWSCATIGASLPSLAWASGETAANLVVVADTRRVSGVLKYIANVYNTDPWLFAVWAVVITALWGGILGFVMDFIMERSGLDLKSRKIQEHEFRGDSQWTGYTCTCQLPGSTYSGPVWC